MLSKKNGMTIVELLTVLAIISILAAIMFPVMSASKRKARESQCMTNMYQIFTAVKMFEQDQHQFPQFIAGPVEFKYPSGNIVYDPMSPSPSSSDPSPDPSNGDPTSPNFGTMPALVPLSQSNGMIGDQLVALFPEYIRSIDGLKCPDAELNGEGMQYTDASCLDPSNIPPLNVRQAAIVQDPMFNQLVALGISSAMRADSRPAYMKDSSNPSDWPDNAAPYYLYRLSSYDYQVPRGHSPALKDPSTGLPYTPEAHYSTIWSASPVGTPGIERQLRWRYPPEDTIITWCSYHRDINSDGTPTDNSQDLVLFLDGRVRRMNSSGFEEWQQAWNNPAPN